MDHVSEITGMLQSVLRALVDEPDKVEVSTLKGRRSVIFEVEVAPRDTHWIIGRGGRTVEALRELLAAQHERGRQRFHLEVFGASTAESLPPALPAPRRRVWVPGGASL